MHQDTSQRAGPWQKTNLVSVSLQPVTQQLPLVCVSGSVYGTLQTPSLQAFPLQALVMKTLAVINPSD